jgi:hypothetical protein
MNSNIIRVKEDSFPVVGTVRIATIGYEMKRTRLTTWIARRARDNLDEE